MRLKTVGSPELRAGIAAILDEHRYIADDGQDIPYWKDCTCGNSSFPWSGHLVDLIADLVDRS